MARIYAFDVDETLEISGGPVRMHDLLVLQSEGNIVGVCGNWAKVVAHPGWHFSIAFIGPAHDGLTKPEFLGQLKRYIPADDYVMVGNDHGERAFTSPDDRKAADEAGWRFLSETSFAKGER